jgi:hypothetical protein
VGGAGDVGCGVRTEPPMFAFDAGVGAVGLLLPPHATNDAIAVAITSHFILSIWIR